MNLKVLFLAGAMLQLQPSGPPPLPPVPPAPARAKRQHGVIPTRTFGNHPQWPRKTVFLTMFNRTVIQTEGATIVPVSPDEWETLTAAYPEEVVTNNLSFYR